LKEEKKRQKLLIEDLKKKNKRLENICIPIFLIQTDHPKIAQIHEFEQPISTKLTKYADNNKNRCKTINVLCLYITEYDRQQD